MPAKISVVQAHEPALYSQTGVSPVLRIGKNGMLPERIVLAGVDRDRDADRQVEIMGDTVTMQVTANTPEIKSLIKPLRYRGWLISTKVIDGQLWLRWQHPRETFPRYSYPVTNRGLADTIRFARFLIDLSIKLEEEHLEASEPKAG